MGEAVFAVAVREIKSTYPPPFWLYAQRWKGTPYRGIFRCRYAPAFSPLEISRSRNGALHVGFYRRPVEAPWMDARMHDRMREARFDETVPLPLSPGESAELAVLESRRGSGKRSDMEALFELYRKIEKNLVLLAYRAAEASPNEPLGFEFLGYDYGDASEYGSRLFDLLFQQWASETAERGFVARWRRSLNRHGLLPTLDSARAWERDLEREKPHPCCRKGATLEIYEARSIQ